MSFAFGGALINSNPINGAAGLATIAGDMKVLYNQTSIVLDWGTVDGANFYTLQVSLFPDFRSTIIDVDITDSDYQFTDGAVNDAKRYWRWKPSVDAGSGYLQPWSEVGSYWLDTGAAAEVDVPQHYWAICDLDDASDIYWFELAPLYNITARNLNRFQGRNRLGTLLSEFLATKDEITLSFSDRQYISHPQFMEFQRFHVEKRVFYLAGYIIGKRREPTPHIWKVEFAYDPQFTMFAAGRPDLLRGSLTLTEV